jgi:hypothetical protein
MTSVKLKVGSLVNIETSFGTEISGYVRGLDKRTDCCIIETLPSNGRPSVSLLNVSCLKAVSEVEGAVDGLARDKLEKLPTIDTEAVSKRTSENERIRQMQEKRLGGPGVSALGQYLFDYISRVFPIPCEWKGTTISVLRGDVRIVEPYIPSKVSGKDADSVERVKLLVEQETKKLVEKGFI